MSDRIIEVIRRGRRGNNGSVALVGSAAKSGDFTATKGDQGYAFRCTAPLTMSFVTAGTLASGWHCIVDAVGGDVTLDPDGAELIEGAATLVVPQSSAALIYTDGTAFYARFFFGSTYDPISGFPTAAGKMLYASAPAAWAEVDSTAYGRSLLALADQAGLQGAVGATATGTALLTAADSDAALAAIGLDHINGGWTFQQSRLRIPTSSADIAHNEPLSGLNWKRIGNIYFIEGAITFSGASAEKTFAYEPPTGWGISPVTIAGAAHFLDDSALSRIPIAAQIAGAVGAGFAGSRALLFYLPSTSSVETSDKITFSFWAHST